MTRLTPEQEQRIRTTGTALLVQDVDDPAAWSRLAEIQPIHEWPTPPDRLALVGPLTIDGQWVANDADTPWFNIGTRALPRKAKKFFRKLVRGRPLGRRERQRGCTVIGSDGVRYRFMPGETP